MVCAVAKSNSPSGAILDAGETMQGKNFSNTFGERLLKIFFDRVGRETNASKLGSRKSLRRLLQRLCSAASEKACSFSRHPERRAHSVSGATIRERISSRDPN